MKAIKCSGHSLEIGLQHGKAAKTEIGRGLVFYEDLFQRNAGISWSEACDVAAKFEPFLRRVCPRFCEEMQASTLPKVHKSITRVIAHRIDSPAGIASGADVPYLSILALNVRTEIAYGLSQDGCTAVYWRSNSSTFLAQNWDWEKEQQQNLINLSISQESKPTINMITEAGIIGKIGLNSKGVGVCLNAIRALGIDFEKIPCHLALRMCLESSSAKEARANLQESGVASACHILVADADEAVGFECTSIDIVGLPTKTILTHTNHLIKPHPGVEDKMALRDSSVRLDRINELIRERSKEWNGSVAPNCQTIRSLLEDEQDFPHSICRMGTKESPLSTLFSIVMDLKERTAEVILDRPSQRDAETLHLTLGNSRTVPIVLSTIISNALVT